MLDDDLARRIGRLESLLDDERLGVERLERCRWPFAYDERRWRGRPWRMLVDDQRRQRLFGRLLYLAYDDGRRRWRRRRLQPSDEHIVLVQYLADRTWFLKFSKFK